MHFSAALLAGGRSIRMGRDKAFLEIDGKPLWQRQLGILQELVPSEIFIAGPSRAEWLQAGLEVVPDAVNGSGPLAGLVGVLRRCTTPHLLAFAVDLPNMTPDFLRRLLASCHPGKGIIPRNDHRFEPLAAVYPVACLSLAESLLQTKRYALQELATCAVSEQLLIEKQISREDEALFFNLNTPEDFAFQRRILPAT